MIITSLTGVKTIRAGSLCAIHRGIEFTAKGVTGRLQEISHRKKIGADTTEVSLYVSGDGWSMSLILDPEDQVEIKVEAL